MAKWHNPHCCVWPTLQMEAICRGETVCLLKLGKNIDQEIHHLCWEIDIKITKKY